jgi:iron complex outermembrane receptor protein
MNKYFNYNAKYHLPKGALNQLRCKECQTNVTQEKNTLDATTNDFGILELEIEWGSNVVQAGLRFDNRQITFIENGTPRRRRLFQRSTDHFSFNAPLKNKLTQNDHAFERSSGFRAPNLALTI